MESKKKVNFWKRSENTEVPDFDFDRDTLEDLIECYTPLEEILALLGVEHKEMDRFCFAVYNMNFKDAYFHLLYKSDAHNRKAFNMLAKQGNQTAMKIVAEHFMKIGKVDQNEVKVQFVCDVPTVESDVEKLGKKEE